MTDKHKYNGVPLDELQFTIPWPIIQWYENESRQNDPQQARYPGLHPNSIHGIIRETPFFDGTSKNGLLWGQAATNWTMWQMCLNRVAFEDRLRQISGIEYVVAEEPQTIGDPENKEDSGVWVIRKLDRRKRKDREDEVSVLGTYYILSSEMGYNMYQAPSVHDIVGNHLLSAMTSLSSFLNVASPLPLFTPATGNTYFPPAQPRSTGQQSLAQPSREGSVAPTHAATATGSRSGSAAPGAAQASTANAAQATDPRDTLALAESLNLMLQYGDEYMDENPLLGVPGSFTFSASQAHLRARQAEAEAAAARAREREAAIKAEEEQRKSKDTSPAASPKPEKAQSPTTEPKAKKPKTGDKAKRRKSKTALSPTSPTTAPTSPVTNTPAQTPG